MANLTTGDLAELGRLLRKRYSTRWQELPFTKGQLLQLGVLIDAELEQAEIDIVQAVPAGPLRQWLIDNDFVSRELIEEVERERKEKLS